MTLNWHFICDFDVKRDFIFTTSKRGSAKSVTKFYVICIFNPPVDYQNLLPSTRGHMISQFSPLCQIERVWTDVAMSDLGCIWHFG